MGKRKKLFIEVCAPPNKIIYLLQTDQPTKVVKYKADNAHQKYRNVTDINIWLSKVQGILFSGILSYGDFILEYCL